jgi:hypothetical protein
MLAALLLASSCNDDDDTADRAAPTSPAPSLASQTIVTATISAAPSTAPTTIRATTLTPSTTGTSTPVSTTTTAPTLAPSTTGSSTTIESGFAPVPQAPPPDEPVDDDASGATELAAEQTCDPASPASPAVMLTWRPATIGTQLVALAVVPDGFETDRYTVSDELPSDRAWFGISPVQPGGLYHWRVLTNSGGGWVASDIAEFTGPTCILDAPSSP